MQAVDSSKLYDAVIIGGGPAGLTAALYLARARYRVLVVERDHFGGQITITAEVVNYPGVLSASGSELTETMRRQAEAFGAEYMLAEVTKLNLDGDIKYVHTTKGEIPCYAVLLATGASPRRLGFIGEDEFRGHGVAYCATCDGEFFTDREVFVVGGGFAAAEESVFLTKYASHVTLLVRGSDFTCAPATAQPAKDNEKIDIQYNTELLEVGGDSALRYLRYRNNLTGEETEYRAPNGENIGVFVFVGYAPATELVRGIAEVNEQGYVVTDAHQMTTADGLFAAGDVCVKTLRQVATAIGQAAQTATDMERYLKDAQEKTGIVPKQPVTRSRAAVEPAKAKEGGSPKEGSHSKEGSGHKSSLFDSDTIAQLHTVFDRMATPLTLRLHLDERPISNELAAYMEELASYTDKLSVVRADTSSVVHADASRADVSQDSAKELPYVEVCRGDEPSGLAFHGVPGGHEFTSFVLGLYNAAGPGQPIADEDRNAIAAINRPISLKVLVGLSCTMCPEVVLACQRIAADSEQVSADVYDINHFENLKNQYEVMSVPCLVIEDADGTEQISFGKKSLADVLELIGA